MKAYTAAERRAQCIARKIAALSASVTRADAEARDRQRRAERRTVRTLKREAFNAL